MTTARDINAACKALHATLRAQSRRIDKGLSAIRNALREAARKEPTP